MLTARQPSGADSLKVGVPSGHGLVRLGCMRRQLDDQRVEHDQYHCSRSDPTNRRPSPSGTMSRTFDRPAGMLSRGLAMTPNRSAPPSSTRRAREKRHRGVLRAGRCDDVVNGSHRPRRRLPDHVRLTTQVHEVHRGQVRHETGAALTREEPRPRRRSKNAARPSTSAGRRPRGRRLSEKGERTAVETVARSGPWRGLVPITGCRAGSRPGSP
jgi:hypothetical protein